MRGLVQIKADRTIIDLEHRSLHLKEMQELVSTGVKDSLIEHVNISGKPDQVPGAMAMYVNEEGLLHRLPVNQVASEMAGQWIVGDVIVVEHEASDFSGGEG